MRILLAEDDFVTRKFMMNFLAKYGDCDVTVDVWKETLAAQVDRTDSKTGLKTDAKKSRDYATIMTDVSDLENYINNVIDPESRIRSVKLRIYPDASADVISDIKRILYQKYAPGIRTEYVSDNNGEILLNRLDEYKYNEFRVIIQSQGILAQKLKLYHKRNGDDDVLTGFEPRRLQLDQLGDYLDDADIAERIDDSFVHAPVGRVTEKHRGVVLEACVPQGHAGAPPVVVPLAQLITAQQADQTVRLLCPLPLGYLL